MEYIKQCSNGGKGGDAGDNPGNGSDPAEYLVRNRQGNESLLDRTSTRPKRARARGPKAENHTLGQGMTPPPVAPAPYTVQASEVNLGTKKMGVRLIREISRAM